MYYMFEPRSRDWYDEDETELPTEPSSSSDVLGSLVLTAVIIILIPIIDLGLVIWMIYEEVLKPKSSNARIRAKRSRSPYLLFGLVATLLAVVLMCVRSGPPEVTPLPASATATVALATMPPRPTADATVALSVQPAATHIARSLPIWVDDFEQQPIEGQPAFFYNRLDGDRGAVGDCTVTWGRGQMTATFTEKGLLCGGWHSLNHPLREGLSIDFRQILPQQILPPYQSAITGISARIAAGTPGAIFRLELKEHGTLRWQDEAILAGGQQVVAFDLPTLGKVNELVWVLDHTAPGDFVVLDSIAFTATTQITDTATAAFVWSLGQLFSNADPESGLVRDKARDANGEFDAAPATGGLAAAVALAAQLGVISREDAVEVVSRISDTLLHDLPRRHGLWPHWVKTTVTGEPIIVPGTEWSSVDSVVAALGLLTGQQALGLDTSGTEAMLRGIEWGELVTAGGISHGYTYDGALIPYVWDAFGGESLLVELAYASTNGRVAPMAYPLPPTANGSGFIDELAFLWVPLPSRLDVWGANWNEYRPAAAETQIAYFRTHYPTSCLARFGLFGLSAAEGPDPSRVSPTNIYQAFALGGRFAAPNDGSALWGTPIVTPHYAAMIASLRPAEATAMWGWLIQQGYLSPLTNVESLMFDVDTGCAPNQATWNSLKGSWNLLLQTLGWGKYLAERRGETSILWQAVTVNPFLSEGFHLLAPSSPAPAPPSGATSRPSPPQQAPLTPFAIYIPPASETPVAPISTLSLAACEGKPLYQWKSLGRSESTGGSSAKATLPEVPNAPTVPKCPDMKNSWRSGIQSFGDRLSEPPVPGTEVHWGCGGSSEMGIRIVGVEAVTTTLGTFQALRIDGHQGYDIGSIWTQKWGWATGVRDLYHASEWWVCGYGLFRLSASHDYNDGVYTGSKQYAERTFVSAMPAAYYESRVRVILADMQLAGNSEAYRGRILDTDVTEALRRWDTGTRVANIGKFERKVIDGKWQIVDAGTELPADGLDIGLNNR